jgi:L-ascorbate metabolism protein UlaG (beta-lactamase superfamily)
MKLTYLGHAAVLVETSSHTLLTDPFLSGVVLEPFLSRVVLELGAVLEL